MRSSTRRILALGSAVPLLLTAAHAPDAAHAQAVPEAPITTIDIGGRDVMHGDPAVSPDGRWLVVSRLEDASRSSLWIAPAAGGEPMRLTDTGELDESPEWAPSGDRIFFTSTRPARGEPGYFIMSMGIDPATGRASGAPRQVTLERYSAVPTPSPDGRLLAYRVGRELRVVPSNGGNSRVLASLPRPALRLAWEPDGSALYYTMNQPSIPGIVLYRIPTGGGTPGEVLRFERKGVAAIAPEARRVVLTYRGPGARERTLEVVDWSGRTVSRNIVSSDVSGRSYSIHGRSLLAVSNDVGAVMRVRPSRGGAARDLTDGSDYGWPVAWTADSRAVITHASTDDALVAQILPLNGGNGREVRVPDAGARWGWGTPTHVSYMLRSDAGADRLVSLDLETGQRTVLSEDVRRGGNVGPGGLYRDIDGFHFAEWADGSVAFRTARHGEPVRTLHTVPEDVADRTIFAFQGNRMAFLQVVGDSVVVMLAEPRHAEPRVLMTLGAGADAVRNCCRTSIAFSTDGEWLVVSPTAPEAAGDAVFARVTAHGRATDVRRVPVDAEYWYEPRWLPDNSGVTVIAGRGGNAWVAFVPTAPGQATRNISGDDRGPTWGHELSPDGRYVAYPSEVWRGSTVWKMDFGSVDRGR